MRKFLTRIGIWAALLAVAMVAYAQFCNVFFSAQAFLDADQSKRAWCLKKANESFDFAVLGSSRAFGSFNMLQLSNLRKQNGINLGANGSGYVDNYLVLHHFLKNKNHIPLLFLQVDIHSLNAKESFSNAFHTYQFLPYWHDPIMKEGIEEFITPRQKFLWTNLPFMRYYVYNKYFSPKEVFRRYKVRDKKSSFDVAKGGSWDGIGKAVENDDNRIALKDSYPSGKRQIDSLDIRYLLKIMALCKANGIKLVAYRAPEFDPYVKAIENYSDITLRIGELLKRDSIPYIEPPASMASDRRYFSDPIHISGEGMETFTSFFYEKTLSY